MADLFGGPPAPAPAPAVSAAKVVLPADRGEGMQVRSVFVKLDGVIFQQVTIENHGQQPLSGFALQYNKNSFGLVPQSPAALGEVIPGPIMPGQSASGNMPVTAAGPLSDSKGVVQMAMKNNVKVFYFQDAVDLTCFLVGANEGGRLDKGVFLEQWKGIQQEARTDVQGLPPAAENIDAVCPKFEASSVFFIARRPPTPEGTIFVYFSVKTMNGVVMLAEVGFRPGTGTASISIKAQQPQYVPLMTESIQKLLRA